MVMFVIYILLFTPFHRKYSEDNFEYVPPVNTENTKKKKKGNGKGAKVSTEFLMYIMFVLLVLEHFLLTIWIFHYLPFSVYYLKILLLSLFMYIASL